MRSNEGNGKNIIMFGSPGAAHSLMKEDLIDGYWLFVNPVLLGKGIPLFGNIEQSKKIEVCFFKHFPFGSSLSLL